MSTTLVKKISLVSKQGISIAEVPKSEEAAKEQLAAGLMSAMLAFSKEVHQRELERLSFHDHTVSFLKVGDEGNFFLVVEINASAKDELANEILRQMLEKANSELDNVGMEDLPFNVAEELLNELYSRDWISSTLDSLGIEKPFVDSEILGFNINLDPNAKQVIESDDNKSYYAAISKFLLDARETINNDRKYLTAFIPMEKPKKLVHYIVSRFLDDRIEVGLLDMDVTKAKTLFRLTPLINREIHKYLEQNPDEGFENMLETLKNTHDIAKGEIAGEDDASLKFLEKNMKKKLDHVLHSVVTGERIIVVGDKFSVKIFSQSLYIYSQHLTTDIVDWLVEDTQIGFGITGMSVAKFKELESSITGEYTLVNLDSGKVQGGTSSKFLKKLQNDAKNLPFQDSVKYIGKSLSDLVSYALKVTSFVLLEKAEAIKSLNELKKEIKNDDQFDIIVKLAKQRNPWLETIIHEISSAIRGAEDYFSNF